MSLLNKITEDYKTAFKAKDPNYKIINGLRAAIKQVQIDSRKDELTDDEILAVIKKEAKSRKDSIKSYEEADRDDLVQIEKDELVVIEGYLPEQMSEEKITEIIDEVIASSDEKDFGKLMGQVMQKTKGQADGGLVNKILKEKLA